MLLMKEEGSDFHSIKSRHRKAWQTIPLDENLEIVIGNKDILDEISANEPWR